MMVSDEVKCDFVDNLEYYTTGCKNSDTFV
jgi:hypothetical protein